MLLLFKENIKDSNYLVFSKYSKSSIVVEKIRFFLKTGLFQIYYEFRTLFMKTKSNISILALRSIIQTLLNSNKFEVLNTDLGVVLPLPKSKTLTLKPINDFFKKMLIVVFTKIIFNREPSFENYNFVRIFFGLGVVNLVPTITKIYGSFSLNF